MKWDKFSLLMLMLILFFFINVVMVIHSILFHDLMLFFTFVPLMFVCMLVLLLKKFLKIIPVGDIPDEYLNIKKCTFLPEEMRLCFNCAFFFDDVECYVPLCIRNWCHRGNEGFIFLNKKLKCDGWLFVDDF